MKSDYERLVAAIKLYEECVTITIYYLDRRYAWSIGWIASIIILMTAGVIYHSLIPIVSGLGFGGLCMALKGDALVTIISKYFKQRMKLEFSVRALQIQIVLCRHDDKRQINKIRDLLKKSLKNLYAVIEEYSSFKSQVNHNN